MRSGKINGITECMAINPELSPYGEPHCFSHGGIAYKGHGKSCGCGRINLTGFGGGYIGLGEHLSGKGDGGGICGVFEPHPILLSGRDK